jgi:hypothetical protein
MAHGETSHGKRPGVWIFASIGAVAAIAIAVALLRPATPTRPGEAAGRSDPGEQQGAVTQKSSPVPRASIQVDRGNTVGPKPDTRNVTPTRFVAGREPGAAPAVPPPDRLALPAVLEVGAIAVEAIRIARLPTAEPIQVQRLDAITPIDVTPLGVDELPRRHE